MKPTIKTIFIAPLLVTISCSKNPSFSPEQLAKISVTTAPASEITFQKALSGGNIKSDVELDDIKRGICWGETANPTLSDRKVESGRGLGSFYAKIDELTPATTYYVRAYAINNFDTIYGNQISFITDSQLAVIGTGTQIWMTKNLVVATYRNGDPIPNVTDAVTWSTLTTGAWCWYNNDSATYAAVYGRLYNWHAVNDSRGLAPSGWHVPSDSEWNILAVFLGGNLVAGCAMKESGIAHWVPPNTYAKNSSGFTGLPAGYRSGDGDFTGIGYYADWWSSSNSQLSHTLSYNDCGLNTLFFRTNRYGLSVRCVKD